MKHQKIIFQVLDLEEDSIINEDDHLSDLGFDSMASIMLITTLEDDFSKEVDPTEIEKLVSVHDLIAFLDELLS